MGTDLLGRAVPERAIDASGKTSSDGGGYSFIFHGNAGNEEDESNKKKEKQPDAPAVKMALSKEAKEKLTNTTPNVDKNKEIDKEENNDKEKSNEIEIANSDGLLKTLLPESEIHKHKIDIKV